MFQQVHALAEQNLSSTAIAAQLHLHPKTVRKYRSLNQLVDHRDDPNGSIVEPYRAYLETRWEQGPLSITTLWEELQTQGFPGSYQSVWSFVRRWPLPTGMQPMLTETPLPPPSHRTAPAAKRTPSQLARLLSLPVAALNSTDRLFREAIDQHAPHLAQAAQLAQAFQQLFQQSEPKALETWLTQAQASSLPVFRRFALDLQNEGDALAQAIALPWSNGPVEGLITKIKLIKRSMYGRASFSLLRQKVLKSA